jgi:hypothetical protein
MAKNKKYRRPSTTYVRWSVAQEEREWARRQAAQGNITPAVGTQEQETKKGESK